MTDSALEVIDGDFVSDISGKHFYQCHGYVSTNNQYLATIVCKVNNTIVGEFEREDGSHTLRKGKLVPALADVTAIMLVRINWEDGESWIRLTNAAGNAIILPRPSQPPMPPPAAMRPRPTQQTSFEPMHRNRRKRRHA